MPDVELPDAVKCNGRDDGGWVSSRGVLNTVFWKPRIAQMDTDFLFGGFWKPTPEQLPL